MDDPRNGYNLEAELYNEENVLQKTNSSEFLAFCKKKLGWTDLYGEVVMDLGCGTGNCSTELMITHFPNLLKIVATDSSEDMIKLAKIRNSRPNIEYFVADVQDESVQRKWFRKASKIISLFCFHWVPDQARAFRNVYNLLEPGGEACVYFPLEAPNYVAYEQVKEAPKWKELLKDVSCATPESQSKKLTASHYQKIFSDIAFDVILCESEKRTFNFPNDERYKKWLRAVCSMFEHIPEHLRDELEEDIWKIGLKYRRKLPDGQCNFGYTALKALLRRPIGSRTL